jgi:hypothetical protein
MRRDRRIVFRTLDTVDRLLAFGALLILRCDWVILARRSRRDGLTAHDIGHRSNCGRRG